MRFRDIILEGDFFMGQTRLPYLCSDIPDEAKVDGSARRKEQLIRALGPDSTEQQRITYVMLTGLGSHTLSAVRELVGLPVEIEGVAVAGEHVCGVGGWGVCVGGSVRRGGRGGGGGVCLCSG